MLKPLDLLISAKENLAICRECSLPLGTGTPLATCKAEAVNGKVGSSSSVRSKQIHHVAVRNGLYFVDVKPLENAVKHRVQIIEKLNNFQWTTLYGNGEKIGEGTERDRR